MVLWQGWVTWAMVLVASTALAQTTPPASPPNQPAQPGQNLKFESAPIHIIAQPPQTEFKDEFQLPDGASPELVANRNLIDFTTSRIQAIADQIDKLMASQTFDSPPEEIQKLKAIQAAYEKELHSLQDAQEAFRKQHHTDTEKIYRALPGPKDIPESETKDLE